MKGEFTGESELIKVFMATRGVVACRRRKGQKRSAGNNESRIRGEHAIPILQSMHADNEDGRKVLRLSNMSHLLHSTCRCFVLLYEHIALVPPAQGLSYSQKSSEPQGKIIGTAILLLL